MIPAHILRLRTATHTLSATTGRAEESAREPEGPAQPHAASHCHLHATAHCQRMKQRKDDGKPTPQVREASKHQACSSGRSFWVCLALRSRGPWGGRGIVRGMPKTFSRRAGLQDVLRFSLARINLAIQRLRFAFIFEPGRSSERGRSRSRVRKDPVDGDGPVRRCTWPSCFYALAHEAHASESVLHFSGNRHRPEGGGQWLDIPLVGHGLVGRSSRGRDEPSRQR